MMLQNNSTMPQTSFGSKFSGRDIAKIKRGKISTAFEMGMKIGRRTVRPQDGARAQMASLERDLAEISQKKGTQSFEIGQSLYFKLFDVERGMPPRTQLPAEGLNHHEIESFAVGNVNTVVDIGYRVGSGEIMPERAIEQLSVRKARIGKNANLDMLKTRLEGIIKPMNSIEHKTALQVTVEHLIKRPVKALAEAFSGVLSSDVDTKHAAKSFEASFKPRQKTAPSKQAGAFEQAFTPRANTPPSEGAQAFDRAFRKDSQR